ncbi:hypothetical protein R1flu_022499 [Riccia fluitans]|uniref:Uncharacterized protein n=1 Tax=Riccia fluitans TaxID=41844 RepID=A0ABD1XPC4_9MARC
MGEDEERKEKKKKDKRDKKKDKDNKEGDQEVKPEGKVKKGNERRRSRVSFLHERQTAPPPPRYAVGEEPPLPTFPITWTPIAVCMETSLPGFSRDALMEVFNTVGRPAMSMSVVHPLDLAEDDARAAVLAAQEGVNAAETLLKEYRSKLKEDRIKEVTARRAKEAETAAAADGGEKTKKGKKDKKEDKEKLKDDKEKKEGNLENKKEKKEKG